MYEANIDDSSCKVAVPVRALPFQLYSSVSAVNSPSILTVPAFMETDTTPIAYELRQFMAWSPLFSVKCNGLMPTVKFG